MGDYLEPTTKFRQVWREINDGNRDIKLLIVQQWWEDKLYSLVPCDKEDESEWRDVPIEYE